MATLCNIFLFTTIGLSFLAGQASYGYKLFNVSLIEGERQGCPNTNCAGKVNCKNDAECPGSKCCIDAVTTMACCYQPGDPTHAPATTDPQNSAQAPSIPFCDSYYKNMATDCVAPKECTCTQQNDCFSDEVCCLEITTAAPAPTPPAPPAPTTKVLCYSTIAPTTTTTAAPVGGKCPTRTPPLQCNPEFDPTVSCKSGDNKSTCPIKQTCCQLSRSGVPCCVTL